MAGAEPRRCRRRWFPSCDEVSSPKQAPSTGSTAPNPRQWARPQPPPGEQLQGARPRVRQLNVRKTALPSEARPKEAHRSHEAPLGQRRGSGKVQLKPQPPAVPCNSSKGTGRIRTKDAVRRSDSPSKMDQDPARKPDYHAAGSKSTSSHITRAAPGTGSAVKPRTPFSGASPFKHAEHRPGHPSHGASSRPGLSRTNSTRTRLFGSDERQHSQGGQQRRIQSAASVCFNATQQQLKATLKVLQQQQKQQQAGHALQDGLSMVSPGEGQVRTSLAGVSAAERLKAAHNRAAAAAQDAIKDVLMTERALHMQQQFVGLQRTAAEASFATQQIDTINSFLAVSTRVQQMIKSTSRRQQQHQEHEPGCGSENTPQPAVHQQEEQQQEQPVSLSGHCSTPRASTALHGVGVTGRNQQCPWSGNVTTNLLFVSTPSSCWGITSPTYAGASTAAAVTAPAPPTPLQEDRSNSMDWSESQPLQSSLKAAKPAQRQEQQESQEGQQQQWCARLHLLASMHDEMLQWFAQYLERDLDRIQPSSRAQCVGMLKAFSKAQDWVALQLDGAVSKPDAAVLTGSTADRATRKSSVAGSLRPDCSSRSVVGSVDGSEGPCHGGDVASVMHLQQLQKALRMKVAQYGVLQYKLSR